MVFGRYDAPRARIMRSFAIDEKTLHPPILMLIPCTSTVLPGQPQVVLLSLPYVIVFVHPYVILPV